MEERNLVIILSDIHMGTDAPTVWYRKEVHEKYLQAVLRHIINLADRIEEVILLGDIFEFWAYPPQQLPPSLNEIIATHPNILGIDGLLLKALDSLQGRMTYIPGDHDMNMSKADMNKLKSQSGYTMKFQYGAYLPIYATHIQFMHGHECTTLNSPYFVSRIAPLPLGYFVTRAVAYRQEKLLGKMPDKTICDLEEYSSFCYNDFLPKLTFFYERFETDMSAVDNLIDAIIEATGMPGDFPIQVNRFTTVTLNEARKIYENKGIIGHQIQLQDMIQEYNKIQVSDDIMKRCSKESTNMIVMGHTHSPMIYHNQTKYVNTGYMCPPVSKLQKNPITYGVYQININDFQLMKVVERKTIQILPFYPMKGSDQTHPTFCYKNSEKRQIKIEESSIIENNYTFGWSVFDASLEFWQAMQEGVLSAAADLGIKILEHDEKSDSIEMVTGSLELISEGINALIIAPYNPQLLPEIVENASQYNIPVVTIDTGTGGAQVAAFIVSDNFGGGILAGEYALDLIEKYSIISKNFAIIKVQETAQYALLRGEGFESVLEEKGYQLVAEVTANSIEEEAYVEMKRILENYQDDLAVVFCENGTMVLGAARAIIEAGKKGKIMLIGFDAGPSVIQAIIRGDVQGTIAQQPYEMGRIGVETANAVLRGTPVAFDDWREKIILMEVFLVDEKGEVSADIR